MLPIRDFRAFLELSDEEAEKVRKLYQKRGPFLEQLFHGKKRVLFPLPPTKTAYAIKQLIEKIPHPNLPNASMYKISHADLKLGIAWLVQKDGRTGDLITKNQTTISRVLASLAANEFDFYDPWKEAERKWKGNNPYWVIVSRHPIDVKRMSDFPNLQSCHSLGGAKYYCTDDEVASGGGVAYLIKPADVEKINLEADEIFEDEDWTATVDDGDEGYEREYPGRNIPGIVPVARVRLRRVIDRTTEQEVGLVEDTVYGIDEGGYLADRFKHAVRQWASMRQAKPLASQPNDLVLKGGSYSNTSAYAMMHYQYHQNKDYIVRLIKKYEKMSDYEEVRKDLVHHFHKSPRTMLKIGKKWWSGGNPESLEEIFAYNWVDAWLGYKTRNQILSPYKIASVAGLHNNPSLTAKLTTELNKFFVSSVGSGNDFKLIQYDDGWVVIEPLAVWIDTMANGNRRLTYQERDFDKKITEDKMLAKLYELVRKTRPAANAKKDEWLTGDFVYHPQFGKGVVTGDGEAQGSIHVKFGRSYNWVDPSSIYRTKQEADDAPFIET